MNIHNLQVLICGGLVLILFPIYIYIVARISMVVLRTTPKIRR